MKVFKFEKITEKKLDLFIAAKSKEESIVFLANYKNLNFDDWKYVREVKEIPDKNQLPHIYKF